jgi:hypothetical protein
MAKRLTSEKGIRSDGETERVGNYAFLSRFEAVALAFSNQPISQSAKLLFL